jgi:hypothetical protein
MAQLLNRVQPGDVITSEMWNLVVDTINELLQSGQSTGIKVAAMVPAGTIAEPIRIGTLLQITGQNFGYSIGQTSVTFTGAVGSAVIARDKMLTGSSDSRLLLIVPQIPGLPQTGATVALRVDNGVATDDRSVFVMPIVVTLQGDVFVSWRADITPNPNPNPLQANQPAGFAFQLQTGINMPATFNLSAAIPNATAAIPPELPASIEFHDESGNTIPNKSVDMGKSETRNIVVRIPQIPQAWANQSFSLRFTATSGNVTNADTRSFTVGTLVPPTDPNIQPQQTGAVVLEVATGNVDTNPLNGKLDGTTISLKPGRQMIVMFNLKLTQTGNHDLTIQPKSGTTLNGWSPQLVNTPSPIPGPVDSRLVQFGVTASAGATSNGTVVFRIARQGATMDWSKEFDVQLLQ